MLLWVLEDNRPAIRFYESLGGERVGRKTVTIGWVDLVGVGYGWGVLPTWQAYTPVQENSVGRKGTMIPLVAACCSLMSL